MSIARAIALILCTLFLLGHSAFGQQIDQKVLEDLRKRYESSFESIYVSDSALNNLSVHLRANAAIEALKRSGTRIEIVNMFRKFLSDIANDRAFLQIELRLLKAGFKKLNDDSAAIQQLPWNDREVFQIAVLCDGYLQGQLKLSNLAALILKNKVSVGDGWTELSELRANPYVPAVTMTTSLNAFVAHMLKNEAQINALSISNPTDYASIKNFKDLVTNPSTTTSGKVKAEWPSQLKSAWLHRYRLLESYGKSTGESNSAAWITQLDSLQSIEFAKIVRTVDIKSE